MPTRSRQCANCFFYGDEQREVRWHSEPLGTCRVGGPERGDEDKSSADLGRFPLMPRHEWCGKHQLTDDPQQRRTATSLSFGVPVNQP